MGSTGSGRISDYPGSSSYRPGGGGPGGGGPGGGGPGDSDRCARAFSVNLEDVERSDYYQQHQSVPPVGTQLKVVKHKRIVAETDDGQVVGNIPTSHNYLAACIKNGWSYFGVVRSVSNVPPEAVVTVDFAASSE